MPLKNYLKISLTVFALLLAVAFLHPYHIHPFRTFYHDGLVVLGVVLALGMLAWHQKIVVPDILALPLLICCLLLLQMIFGLVSFENGILALAYFFLAMMAMLLGASWFKVAGGAEPICLMLASVYLLVALVSVVMECIQVAGINASPVVLYIAPDAQAFMRPFANVAQPNQLALMLCMALASVWYLFQKFRLAAFTACLFSLILLWGLVLTQSRIGWIIIPVFCLFLISRKPALSAERSISRALLCLLVILYFALVAGLPEIAKLTGFSAGSVAEHVAGRSERMVLWKQAWSMAQTHPWIGVGWFGFGAEQVRIAADFSSTTYAEHAHNWPLNFAAEFGFPATFLIFSGLLLWARYVLGGISYGMKNSELAFAVLCLGAVLVHSMVEFPLWYAYVLLPVAVLMGILDQMREPQRPFSTVLKTKAIFISVPLALLLCALLTYDYQRVVKGFKALRNTEGVVVNLTEAPEFTIFGAYFDYFYFMKMHPHKHMSSQEIAFARHMSERFGFVHVLNKLAEIYVLNDMPEQAQRTMLTLQRLHPIVYPEYYDYWRQMAAVNPNYQKIFQGMPKRDAE